MPPKLEVGDEATLMMKENIAKSAKGTQHMTTPPFSVVYVEAHWGCNNHAAKAARPSVTWLRRNEYMGTDLYDAVHKVGSPTPLLS